MKITPINNHVEFFKVLRTDNGSIRSVERNCSELAKHIHELSPQEIIEFVAKHNRRLSIARNQGLYLQFVSQTL